MRSRFGGCRCRNSRRRRVGDRSRRWDRPRRLPLRLRMGCRENHRKGRPTAWISLVEPSSRRVCTSTHFGVWSAHASTVSTAVCWVTIIVWVVDADLIVRAREGCDSAAEGIRDTYAWAVGTRIAVWGCRIDNADLARCAWWQSSAATAGLGGSRCWR